MTTIFETPLGRHSVWREDNGSYGSFGAGHILAVDMAKEIERLRDLLPPNRQPTELTAQLRAAVAHEQSEYGYEWKDKPHRLVYRACEAIEMQAVEIESLRAINAELVAAIDRAKERA